MRMDHAHSCLVIPIFIWYSIPRCSITDSPYLQPPKVAVGDMSQRSVVTGVPSELERYPQRRGFTPRWPSLPIRSPTEAQPRRAGNRLTAGRGHCPEMFVLIQDGTRLCPPMWGSNYFVNSPSRKSPSEILRFVDFPTSSESTPGANRQPVYRERIREWSIARPFPTGIASPKSRARESLMQPVRPHEAVESRSRA